jgi:hypothetical protein
MNKTPVRKFYLRKNIDDNTASLLADYVGQFGSAPGRIERFRGESLLSVYSREDANLVKSEFGELIDAEVDCR